MFFLVCLFFDSSLPFKECFFFRKKKSLWVWKNVLSLSEPKPNARAAFRVVIDNNWQGIAYLMLEVSGLDFLEAIQVAEIVAALKLVTNTYMTNNLAGKQSQKWETRLFLCTLCDSLSHTGYFLLFTRSVVYPVQQSVTSLNTREPVLFLEEAVRGQRMKNNKNDNNVNLINFL